MLLDPEPVIRHTAAQVIGAVAGIDLPRKQWGGAAGVIPSILQCVTAAAGVAEGSKQAALEALGYVCEELDDGDLDEQQTNQVPPPPPQASQVAAGLVATPPRRPCSHAASQAL